MILRWNPQKALGRVVIASKNCGVCGTILRSNPLRALLKHPTALRSMSASKKSGAEQKLRMATPEVGWLSIRWHQHLPYHHQVNVDKGAWSVSDIRDMCTSTFYWDYSSFTYCTFLLTRRIRIIGFCERKHQNICPQAHPLVAGIDICCFHLHLSSVRTHATCKLGLRHSRLH